MSEPDLKLLNPREVRRANEIKVDIGDGMYVRARRDDVTAMVFDGRVPMPILTAVQKLIEMPHSTSAERVKALGDAGKTLIEVVREHAVRVVIEPKLSLTETGDLDVLPVDYLNVNQLMAIWTETAVTPNIGPERAARFHRGQFATDDSPESDGGEVRQSPKLVAVEPPSEIEYVGQ